MQPDILCFSSTDWEGVWGSRQQVMLRFARRGYRVLYIERPVGLEHLLRYDHFRRRKFRRWREGLRRVENNLHILSLPPLVPGRYYSTSINNINYRFVRRWLQRYTKKWGIDRPILWLYLPEHGPLVGQFNELLSVYHCIDEWTANTTGRKRATISALETELLGRVDLVLANSPPTYENKRRYNPQTYRIPSGVDVDFFTQALNPATAIHPALAHITSPIIGYSGHVNERLNYQVIEYLARQRPAWSFVFVGDTYPWTLDTPPLNRLRQLPNVYFLGKYPYAEMPALIKGMDVCLVPYVSDERGYYRSPLKLYEYLAAGKPVVSTTHPEVEEFGEVVSIASSPEAFLGCVEQALTDDNEQRQHQRVVLARQHSWDSRVDRMEEIIQPRLGLA
ncbi:MAG: glycosyltransferase [Anaerolineae bacterium]|nr:glycosyltransferase [Anaerolineae bacterium]MCB0222897.1 glycosyltransferase [Anaerolineae bacterium]